MVGRKKEVAELNELYDDGRAEFVAIYGRRRVGKTYLVDETMSGRITFRHTGLSPIEGGSLNKSPTKAQLQAFYYSLKRQGMVGHCPKDWQEAFFMLEMLLEQKDTGERQVVFIDELPWLDTARSGFITGLEAFWNGWACHRKNFMLIVCGSASSWIRDKLINNHGGLYNRVTREIKLEPFSLCECELLLRDRGVSLSRYDIAQSYMILGGIPYYLNYLARGKSLAQSIDELFFAGNAVLRSEYDRLFSSAFTNPELMKKIVEFLSTKSGGFSRRELVKGACIPDGGMLSDAISSLIACDFITKYVPFALGKREEHYKLVDPFCIFYLRFVKNADAMNAAFWLENVNAPAVAAFRGYAFENVCFNHIRQIKAALEIGGVSTRQSAWSKTDADKGGTQIDLIIERRDNIVNMCEIKFCGSVFSVDKSYDMVLRHRQSVLAEELSPKMAIHNTLITTFGLKSNEYSGIFPSVITLDDLFK